MAWIKGNKILLTTGIALLFTLLYKFVFINKEEIFKGASILGDLTYNLSSRDLDSQLYFGSVTYSRPIDRQAASKINGSLCRKYIRNNESIFSSSDRIDFRMMFKV